MLLSINGERVDPAQAQISVFDRGFLFGDAIYDVVTTRDGRQLCHAEDHLDRLLRSGASIGLDIRPLRPQIEAEVRRMIEDLPGEGELTIRIMVTRGCSSDIDLLNVEGEPTWIVFAKPTPTWNPRLYNAGIRLSAVEPEAVVARISPGVKSNNRQSNVMAHRIARERGFDDALFVDPSGCVTEGPTWNAFFVKDGVVRTHPLEGGILAGVTRKRTLAHCAELGISTEEARITLEEARAADEAFITSTTRGVMPVGCLDDAIYESVPGPVTSRLRAALTHSQG
jgi:branched-subunit amino acid aminotransferase/4-amino-4-deoxychorismate lyase